MHARYPLCHRLVIAASVALAALGLYMLTLPDIALFRQWPYRMLPRAEIVIALAVALGCFSRHAAHYVLWLGLKLYRIAAALMVLALMGAEGLLHVFSIPHVEGWWISLAGSLIAASGIGAWLKKQTHCATCDHPKPSENPKE